MKFKINDVEYEIIEVNQNEFIKTKEEAEDENYFLWGQTRFDTFKVLIYKDLPIGQKRKTLMHELMHIYLKTYMTNEVLENITEEILCDISANSHDIINDIIREYFKNTTIL